MIRDAVSCPRSSVKQDEPNSIIIKMLAAGKEGESELILALNASDITQLKTASLIARKLDLSDGEDLPPVEDSN